MRLGGAIRIIPFALMLAGLIVMAGAQVAVSKKRPKCFGHRATIVGTKHRDHIVVKPHAVVAARGGNDRITVAKGDHTGHIICGGPGDDYVKARTGADIVIGGPGNDELRSGNGDDLVVGDNANRNGDESGKTGRDFLSGSNGRDFIVGDNYATGNASWARQDFLTGGKGPDTIIGDDASVGAGNATGVANDGHLAGASGDDRVIGDSFTVSGTATGGGNDGVYGGPGQDLQVGDGYTVRGTADGAGRDILIAADGGDFSRTCHPANSCADVFYGDGYKAACAANRTVAANAQVDVIRCENRSTHGGRPDLLISDQGDDFMNGGLPDPDPGAGSGDTVDRCNGGTGRDIATSCKPVKRGFQRELPFARP